MSDQNQNQIPGNLRTLKTDLEMNKSNPQDRLQQSGNFVQARPTNEKKDIPTTNTQPSYSWSNMNTNNTQSNNSTFKPAPTASVENKSGLSILDDSIDLPIEKPIISNNTNPATEALPSSPVINQPNPAAPIKTEINTQANAFDINSLNLQDDSSNPKPKALNKALFPALIVIILLGLIGGGLYFYFNMSSNDEADITDNTEQNISDPVDDITEEPIDIQPENPISTFSSPLKQDSAVDIAFVDAEPIRSTISKYLIDERDILIQLNLTKNDTSVSLIDIADVLGLTIPSIETIVDYRLYAYNQQGVYKLVAVLGLAEGQEAKSFLLNWANSIPRDLAGFSINIPSRIVNTPTIKKSVITNNSDKVFENYYYNYTSPSDSIDVSSYKNYLLMTSSQDAMNYILDQIQ